MISWFDLPVYAIVFVQTLHFTYILELTHVIVVKSNFSGALEKKRLPVSTRTRKLS